VMNSRRFTAQCLRASTERIAQPEGLLRCGISNPAFIRFGSAADITPHLADVRFTPERRHRATRPACPLSAKSGLLQCKTLCPLWTKTEHELAAGWECAARQL